MTNNHCQVGQNKWNSQSDKISKSLNLNSTLHCKYKSQIQHFYLNRSKKCNLQLMDHCIPCNLNGMHYNLKDQIRSHRNCYCISILLMTKNCYYHCKMNTDWTETLYTNYSWHGKPCRLQGQNQIESNPHRMYTVQDLHLNHYAKLSTLNTHLCLSLIHI